MECEQAVTCAWCQILLGLTAAGTSQGQLRPTVPAYPENLGAWGVVGAGGGANNDGGGELEHPVVSLRVERQGVAAVGDWEPPGYGEM